MGQRVGAGVGAGAGHGVGAGEGKGRSGDLQYGFTIQFQMVKFCRFTLWPPLKMTDRSRSRNRSRSRTRSRGRSRSRRNFSSICFDIANLDILRHDC